MHVSINFHAKLTTNSNGLKNLALANLNIIDVFRSIYVVAWQQHASVWMKSTYWNKTTFFAQNTDMFPNLEKLFGEKTITWNMVLFQFRPYTKKLFESDRILY